MGAELGQLEMRGSGKRRLPTEDPVELDGVAHRLVDLECKLAALENEGALVLGARIGL